MVNWRPENRRLASSPRADQRGQSPRFPLIPSMREKVRLIAVCAYAVSIDPLFRHAGASQLDAYRPL